MAMYELILRGYQGDTDATDHLILWVDTDMSEEQTKACLAEAALLGTDGIVSAVSTVPERLSDMSQADFVLPRDIEELKARATGLVAQTDLVLPRDSVETVPLSRPVLDQVLAALDTANKPLMQMGSWQETRMQLCDAATALRQEMEKAKKLA